MESVKEFLDYLKYEKRYSIHTLTAYQTDLNQFLHFLSIQYELADSKSATHQQIRSWLVTLYSDGIVGRSIQRKIATLRSFYKYLKVQGIISKSPMQRIESPKSPSRLPAVISEQSIHDLFAVKPDPQNGENPYNNLLNRTLLLTLYHTGIRLSELINLNTHDVNLRKLEMKVLGKRNKERIIPFSSELGDEIRAYIQVKNDLENRGENHLFVLGNGKPLYAKYLQRLVKSSLIPVTTIKKKSPHMMRHSYATHLMNHGADINSIKELLGHSSLAATQVYTHTNIEKLKQTYKKAHPRADKTD